MFQGRAQGYAYGRQGNPTSAALEAKVNAMEGGVATRVLRDRHGRDRRDPDRAAQGRRPRRVAQFLFGNTNSLFDTLATHGTRRDVRRRDRRAQRRGAITPATRLVFVETIANPRTQVADLARIGEVCRARGILYVVDNTMTSPWLFRPVDVGAGLIVNALTKYIGGHGNALGGTVTDTGLFDWTRYPNIADSYKKQKPAMWGITQLRKKGLRDFGATLGAEPAHHIAIGAETLALRMDRQCANALALARFLEAHPRRARRPLPRACRRTRSTRWRVRCSAIPARCSRSSSHAGIDCFAVLDRLRVVVLSSNLGDNRTLAIPVAQTIFYEMGAARRAADGHCATRWSASRSASRTSTTCSRISRRRSSCGVTPHDLRTAAGCGPAFAAVRGTPASADACDARAASAAARRTPPT